VCCLADYSNAIMLIVFVYSMVCFAQIIHKLSKT